MGETWSSTLKEAKEKPAAKANIPDNKEHNQLSEIKAGKLVASRDPNYMTLAGLNSKAILGTTESNPKVDPNYVPDPSAPTNDDAPNSASSDQQPSGDPTEFANPSTKPNSNPDVKPDTKPDARSP